MAKTLVLLHILFSCTITSTISQPSLMVKPDCLEKCGNMTVPYPFGIAGGDSQCYKYLFHVTCNDSFTPPKLFIGKSNIEILNISLQQGQMRVSKYVGYEKYSKSGYLLDWFYPYFILGYGWPYTISDKLNRFTVIGCDTYAYFKGYKGDQPFLNGCSMLCNDEESITEGSCSGIGCCYTSIPKGLKEFNVSIYSFNNYTDVWEFNSCSYAFLVENDFYKFSKSDLSCGGFESTYGTELPIILDWSIGNIPCKRAKLNSTTFACNSNSDCFDSPSGFGYFCKCSKGYQGNPYLKNGCQDVDECKDPNNNPCKGRCVNTVGDYECVCPPGTKGNASGDGFGCIPNSFPVLPVVIGSSAGLLILFIGSSLLYWGLQRRKLSKLREKFFKQNGGLLLKKKLSWQGHKEATKIFTPEELAEATKNYDESRIVGQGGNGIVYKGILPDKREVAIKKARGIDGNQVEEFINEVIILSQINHINVVKLLGCCLEVEIPILVYEFVKNGSLFHHLHDDEHKSSIPWETRLSIAADTAGALSYLHSAASPPIIHRDVKSANILLDDNFTTKVADFGASRLFSLDKTQITTLVQGTLGYLDPEYIQTNQLTEKSDVYSFGVVLLELLTGKIALSFARPEKERSLAMRFITSMEEERVFDILENRVLQEGSKEQIIKITKLVKRCLNVNGKERPTMKEMAMELEGMRRFQKYRFTERKPDEGEYLLGDPSDIYGQNTIGYDSLRDQVVIPLEIDDGR